jgi:hypothetical protein
LAKWIKREDPTIVVYKRPILLTEINTGFGAGRRARKEANNLCSDDVTRVR